MAKPIEATPTLSGDDAKRFYEEMKKHITPDDIADLERAKKAYKTIKVHM
jgi:hypothetical protein